jgi:carboxylesterase type B
MLSFTYNVPGNIAPGIESIINSHTFDEAAMFTPSTVDDAVINAVLDLYFGTSPATKSAILKKFSTISNAKARIKSLYQFSTFTCSNRFISEGFPGKTYNLQYSRGTGYHGSDIGADFYIAKSGFDFSSLTDRTFGTFATTFQQYLLSHARTGNPSTLREKGSIEWPLVTMGPTLTGVMNATDKGFELIADEKTREEDCGFWKDVLAGMTSSMGTLYNVFRCRIVR